MAAASAGPYASKNCFSFSADRSCNTHTCTHTNLHTRMWKFLFFHSHRCLMGSLCALLQLMLLFYVFSLSLSDPANTQQRLSVAPSNVCGCSHSAPHRQLTKFKRETESDPSCPTLTQTLHVEDQV